MRLNKTLTPWPALCAGLFFTLSPISGRPAEPPSTVSDPARAFLETATPFDMGRPTDEAEWAALRNAISEAFDQSETLQARAPYRTKVAHLGGVPVTAFHPQSEVRHPHKRIMFLHGGAYVSGTATSGSSLIVPVMTKSSIPVISVDYRLAPEHPFPAALNDAMSVYATLIERYGAGNVGVFGSSAGASLAAAMLLMAQEKGLAMPGALALLSPWSELGPEGDSYVTLEGTAPVLSWSLTLENAARLYAPESRWRDPLVSPVHGQFQAPFPATLMQTGTRDLFLSNSVRLHRKLVAVDVDARLSVWEGMWHAFQMNINLPEAKEALAEVGQFLEQELTAPRVQAPVSEEDPRR